MEDTHFVYRLSPRKKADIAQNLMDVLERDTAISRDTAIFVGNWILTGSDEKRKAFFDVWDIVLRNYMPSSRPVLFRSCTRRTDGRIASFTGRLECARRFCAGKGLLLICDTAEVLKYEEDFYRPGEYRHTFYPVVELLNKARNSGKRVFSERLLTEYAGEEEYVMRVDLGYMHTLKWRAD